MNGGTLLLLNAPADQPLETTHNNGQPPAIEVKTRESRLESGGLAQHGRVAGFTSSEHRPIHVTESGTIHREAPEQVRERTMCQWAGDVTGTGLLICGSVAGEDRTAFPLDVFSSQLGRECHLVEIDVPALVEQWQDRDMLMRSWLVADDEVPDEDDDDAERAAMLYHRAAEETDAEATVGLGFIVEWDGTYGRGVVYRSGYVGLYSNWSEPVAVDFVNQELLPVVERVGPDGYQATLSGEVSA
jgi:hypothetical protein